MKSILLTLFNTKRGFELLDNEFEDDLRRKSILIFSFYGIVQFLCNDHLHTESDEFIISLLKLTMTVCFFVLIGMLFSFILFIIGEWIGGKANYIEVFSLLAYTFIPIIIGLIIVRVLRKNEFFISDLNNRDSRNFILYLSWFFSLKILVQGLIKFNKYGIKKAIVNISPFIAFQIGIQIFKLIKSI